MPKSRKGEVGGGGKKGGKAMRIIGASSSSVKKRDRIPKETQKMKKQRISKLIEKKKEKRKEDEGMTRKEAKGRGKREEKGRKREEAGGERKRKRVVGLAPGLIEAAQKEGKSVSPTVMKYVSNRELQQPPKGKKEEKKEEKKEGKREQDEREKKRKKKEEEKEEVSLTPFEAKKKKNETRLALIEQAKVLWEKAREKSISGEERRPLIDQLHDKMKGRYCEIILKHDASRIVQTVIKYGTTIQKETIVREIRPSFLLVIKSTYGSFLIKKILKYVHSKVREEIFEKDLRTHFPSLILHSHAFRAIECMYELANSRQRNLILDEFYDQEYVSLKPAHPVKLDELLKSSEKKKIVLANLKKFTEKFVNKLSERGEENPSALSPKIVAMLGMSLFHQLLFDYLSFVGDKEKQDMIGFVKEYILHMIHTRPGHRIGCICVAYGTALDRKTICKSLKGLVMNAATEPVGHHLILSLFCFVDDTTLLKKSVLDELNANMKDVLFDVNGHLCYIAAICGRKTTSLSSYTSSLLAPVFVQEKPTSLKDEEKRHKELRGGCQSKLLDFFLSNLEDVLRDSHASSVLLALLEKLEEGDRNKIFEAFLEIVPSQVNEVGEEEELSIMEERTSTRVIRKMISFSDKLDSSSDSKLSTLLYKKMKANLIKWATRKGSCFIVVSLLESPTTSKEVRTLLSSSKKVLQSSDVPGSAILLKNLSGKKK